MFKVIKFAALPLVLLFIIGSKSYSEVESPGEIIESVEEDLCITKRLNINGLTPEAFQWAYKGWTGLKKKNKLQIDTLLTVVDFSKPSNEDRLFIIDLKNEKLVLSSLVAHGMNTGEVEAEIFSNTPSSHKSSLGAYVTSHTYQGRHGYSLRLLGMEQELNSNAHKRAIVVHGADYVSHSYISENGRLGRSFGCPAIPRSLNDYVIDLIKDGSCLYIYHPTIANYSLSLY